MIALGAIVVLAALPLAPLVLGSVCGGNGHVIARAVSSMAISALISTFAWPLAAAALVLWVVAVIVHLVIRRWRRRRAAGVA